MTLSSSHYFLDCSIIEAILDEAVQHESPTYKCESRWVKGRCPYIGQQLLQKVSRTANGNDDDDM